jgi:hypothetical protein
MIKINILPNNCLHSRLRFDAFTLILLPHDNRSLKRSKHITNLVLNGLRERCPFRLDSPLGYLPDLGLQVRETLVARFIVRRVAFAGTLSLWGHCAVS